MLRIANNKFFRYRNYQLLQHIDSSHPLTEWDSKGTALFLSQKNRACACAIRFSCKGKLENLPLRSLLGTCNPFGLIVAIRAAS